MKILGWLGTLVGLYAAVCLLLYLVQERLLFFPTQLPADYQFTFDSTFEEVSLTAADGTPLSAVHFKAASPKGAVLFLHGNAGAIHGWGQAADLYVDNGFDVLFLDYRGYGKSEGKITGEAQLIADAQLAYDHLKQDFEEDQIIVSGTSIGTGMAVQVAAQNAPALLLLNAPYASLASLIQEKTKIVPTPIIKYPLRSNQHLQQVRCPVYIFHGDRDELIPIQHALRLKKQYDHIALTVLNGYGHNNLTESPVYVAKMNEILSRPTPKR